LKILLLDIETAPNLAYVWGLWEQNVSLSQIHKDNYILSWSAKWLGEEEVFFSSRQHSKEKDLLSKMWKLLDEADAVVHYNGKRFDIPWLQGAFVRLNFLPPSPFKQIDLLETVKRQFRFPSNKLEYVCKAFGLGEKIKTDFELWVGCIEGEEESWNKMSEYNKNDTLILEQLYFKLLPWIKGHTNYGLFTYGEKPVCPNCGSTNLQRRGITTTLASVYQRYRCSSCGHWSKDNKILNRKQFKTTSIQ